MEENKTPLDSSHCSMEGESAETSTNDKSKRKRLRHRKKLLHELIKKQIEFYFSDANLSKDRYMQQLLQNGQEVDLENFLKFNKLKNLTEDCGELAKALQSSELLKVTEDGKRVFRSVPFTPRSKEDEEESTIYVENLPSTVTHDWLVSVFSEFGNVAYVSLPKFKKSGRIKGFAFIEFDSPQSAGKALQAYKDAGSYLPMDTDPGTLCSISTFNNEDLPEDGKNHNAPAVDTNETRKRKDIEDGPPETQNEQKKIKVEESSEDESGDQDGTSKSAKKKRKRKKVQKAEKQEVEALALHVLSKKDWKRLRNKYLNMQRENMRQMKNAYRFQKAANKKEETKPQQAEAVHIPEVKESEKSEDFAAGVIVRLELDEPITDAKRFKGQVRVQEGVSYVDAEENSKQAYVRCTGPDAARELVEKAIWPKAEIIQGEEESKYWEKIRENREKKKQTNTRSKERGRDRWKRKLQKVSATKSNLHIHFDE